MDARKPPPGLKRAGKSLWRELLDAFELGEHERRVLVEACRTVDALDDLAAVVAEDGVMGSDGRPHPALIEQRQQRVALTRLIASLRVPDGEEDTAHRPQRRGASRGSYRTPNVGPRLAALRGNPEDAS